MTFSVRHPMRSNSQSTHVVAFLVGVLTGLTSLLSAAKAAESPLADATEKSDRTTIRTLLKQRADVNGVQADGMTALHWAAQRDDLETAKALLEAKANVKATNQFGVTPLSLACQNGSASMVELLLEHGADQNTTLRGS